MAILGQFPPNLVVVIGILRPARWTIAAARRWSRADDAAFLARSTPKKPSRKKRHRRK